MVLPLAADARLSSRVGALGVVAPTLGVVGFEQHGPVGRVESFGGGAGMLPSEGNDERFDAGGLQHLGTDSPWRRYGEPSP